MPGKRVTSPLFGKWRSFTAARQIDRPNPCFFPDAQSHDDALSHKKIYFFFYVALAFLIFLWYNISMIDTIYIYGRYILRK